MSVALDEFSAVVGQVYEASLDVSAWERTLEATCRFVGASKATLNSLARHERQYQLEVAVGYEPGWIDLLNRKYAALNPLGGTAHGVEVGEVLCLSEHGLIGAFEGDPMYEEWVKPQGILDVAELVVDRTIGHVGTLAYTRVQSEGVFTAEALDRIRLLFPHVRRSVLISRVLKMHRRGERELAEVVGALASGVFLLSAGGQIMRSNAAGEAMLAARIPVTQAAGRLKLDDPAADRAFVETLQSARLGPAALGAKGVSIPLRAARGDKHVAHLLPLSAASALDDLKTQDAVMALFVNRSNPDLTGALATMARTYGLTPAERRVAMALVEVGSTPMIAETIGVSVATVRTHLRSLYEKTGARRQVDIVSLLQGVHSPFAG